MDFISVLSALFASLIVGLLPTAALGAYLHHRGLLFYVRQENRLTLLLSSYALFATLVFSFIIDMARPV